MEEKTGYYIVIIVLFVLLLWSLVFHENKYEGLSAESWFYNYENELYEKNELEWQISDLEEKINACNWAVDEANDNIEKGNDMIWEARGSAWASYEEMGNALDNLNEIETVWY